MYRNVATWKMPAMEQRSHTTALWHICIFIAFLHYLLCTTCHVHEACGFMMSRMYVTHYMCALNGMVCSTDNHVKFHIFCIYIYYLYL